MSYDLKNYKMITNVGSLTLLYDFSVWGMVKIRCVEMVWLIHSGFRIIENTNKLFIYLSYDYDF